MSPRLPQRPGPIRMNWRFGSSWLSLADGPPDRPQVRTVGQLVVLLGMT